MLEVLLFNIHIIAIYLFLSFFFFFPPLGKCHETLKLLVLLFKALKALNYIRIGVPVYSTANNTASLQLPASS